MGYYIKNYTTGKIIGPFKTHFQACHYLYKHPEVLIVFKCYYKENCSSIFKPLELNYTRFVLDLYKERYE